MIKYDWKKATPEMSEKEVQKLLKENKKNAFMYAHDNLEEIQKIFKTQLEKPGHEDRKMAAEEIVNYLVKNYKIKYEATRDMDTITKNWDKASSLVEVANIIDAVNKDKKKEVEDAFKQINLENSDNADQISWNIMQFAYWIMSDEARTKYDDIIRKHISQHKNLSDNKTLPETVIQEFKSLKNLEALKTHNELTKELYTVKTL